MSTGNGTSRSSKSRNKLGVITKGSLVEGLEMKLSPERSVEDLKAGKFVVVEGDKNEFFSMVRNWSHY